MKVKKQSRQLSEKDFISVKDMAKIVESQECAPQRYFLDQDNDCHWFLVEADKRAEWEAWLEIDSGDEKSWTPPNCAEELPGGPSDVIFENPTFA